MPDPLHDQVLAAHPAGKPAEEIASWFAIPAERVQQIITGVPSRAQRPASRRKWWLLAVAAVVLLAGATAAVLVLDSRSGKLQAAKDDCAESEAGARVADDGATLIFDGRGADDPSGAPTSAPVCVLNEIKAPQAVLAHMDSTSALNGRQEDAWDGFTASWTYHPDNGIDLIIRAR